LKQQLSDLIVSVLRTHPSLCYFQGYHDIAQVLLLVLGPEDSVEAVTRLSLLRIRDFMMSNLSSALTHLRLIPYILHAADPELAQHLPSQPFYALSTTLTLYAHDIQGYGEIARLFDFLLAREAVTSVYLFCEIIRMQRTELLEIEPQDTDMMHFTLSKLPSPLDIETLIASTMTLMKNHPPESLSYLAWHRVSGASTLKTTRDPVQVASQTLQQGEVWLADQERLMKRQQTIDTAIKQAKKIASQYRSRALFGLTAVAIGVLSLWLGRGGGLDVVYRNLFAESIAGPNTVFGGVMAQIYRSLGGTVRE
jgi:hypothetical protein